MTSNNTRPFKSFILGEDSRKKIGGLTYLYFLGESNPGKMQGGDRGKINHAKSYEGEAR